MMLKLLVILRYSKYPDCDGSFQVVWYLSNTSVSAVCEIVTPVAALSTGVANPCTLS